MGIGKGAIRDAPPHPRAPVAAVACYFPSVMMHHSRARRLPHLHRYATSAENGRDAGCVPSRAEGKDIHGT